MPLTLLLNFFLAEGLIERNNHPNKTLCKPCDPKNPVCTPLSMSMYLYVMKMLNIALHRTRSNANLSAASHHLCLGPHNALDTGQHLAEIKSLILRLHKGN